MKVALLASFDSYYCVDLIDRLWKSGAPPVDVSVFFVGTSFDSKSYEIHRSRTSGYQRRSIVESCSPTTPCYFSDNVNSPRTVDLIRQLGIDVCALAGINQILKGEILTTPRLGVINVHPGELPYFQGCSCVEWAVHLDRRICNSAHFCDQGIDTGPIIQIKSVPLDGITSYWELRTRVYEHGLEVMLLALWKLLNGMTPSFATPQGPGTYHRIMREPLLSETIRKFGSGDYRPV